MKADGKIEITMTYLSDDTLVEGEFEIYYDNENAERQKTMIVIHCFRQLCKDP
jgi:hypothetical protein